MKIVDFRNIKDAYYRGVALKEIHHNGKVVWKKPVVPK